MTLIVLETEINAAIDTCFDLSRDIDVHKLSTAKTNEVAVAGRMKGLCELGDNITWEATHLGIRQQLSVEITQFKSPVFFEDHMTKGAFKSMRHEHHFRQEGKTTIMLDKFDYEVPLGFIGRMFDRMILKRYMTRFLLVRNQTIKKIAETI